VNLTTAIRSGNPIGVNHDWHMFRRALPATVALGIALCGLCASSAEASSRGVIAGVVTDATGDRVEGAVIRYHSLEGDHEQVSTDSHGSYRLRVKAPVHAYLDVYTRSPYPSWTSGDITFDPKSTLIQDVTLSEVGVPTLLYGRVSDAQTGKPVPRLRVSSLIHEGDNDNETYTDRDGWYAFSEYDARGEGYYPLHGTYTYDLFTEATRKYTAIAYNEEDPAAAGSGLVVSEGQKIRFDFAVPRRSHS
jgi:carboxypeptidase family protein